MNIWTCNVTGKGVAITAGSLLSYMCLWIDSLPPVNIYSHNHVFVYVQSVIPLLCGLNCPCWCWFTWPGGSHRKGCNLQFYWQLQVANGNLFLWPAVCVWGVHWLGAFALKSFKKQTVERQYSKTCLTQPPPREITSVRRQVPWTPLQ